MNELTALPCPFCGSQPYVAMKDVAVISCRSDDCFGPRTTADYLVDAVKQWNARAPQPVAVAQTSSDAKERLDLAVKIDTWSPQSKPLILIARERRLIAAALASPAQSSWHPSPEAIAAVIDPVAFDPISLTDTHPSWDWRREAARATAAQILMLTPSVASTDYCTPDGPANCEAWAVEKRCPSCPVSSTDKSGAA